MTDHIAFDADVAMTAYAQGAAVAANYKVGDQFLGAFGEAEKFGYGPGSYQRSVFTTGYIGNLKHPIVTAGREDLTLIQYGA